MQLTLEIPELVAEQLADAGADPVRLSLEGLALLGYRNGQLSAGAIRQLLGFESRWDVWTFLRERNEPSNYSLDDWEQDKRVVDEHLSELKKSHDADALVTP